MPQANVDASEKINQALASYQAERGTVVLFRIAGVPVFVHWSLLAGAVFLYWFAKFQVEAALGLLVSYVVVIGSHEAAHALAARTAGLQVFSLSISGVGGLCRFQSPRSYGPAFFVISAGLLTQLILFIATVVSLWIVGPSKSTYGSYMVFGFTYLNGALVVLNLIPGKSRNGLGSDGYLLWNLALKAFRRQPFAMPDTSPTFPPATRLSELDGFKPIGLEHGVELLNDNTTPMEFVVNALTTHLGVPREEAIRLMLHIHQTGGQIIPLPTFERALAVAEGITADAAANGYKLVCRAVGGQPAVPAGHVVPLGPPLNRER